MVKDDKFSDLAWQQSKLIANISFLIPSSIATKLLQALELAKKEHFGQLRADGTPYIIHPIRVALILIEELNIKDPDLLAAALLHDVIEDGSVSSNEIKRQFGSETARLVEGLTRPKPKNETEKEKLKNKLEYIKKIAQSDEKIRLVKLCDVLDNNRSHAYIPKTSPSFKKIPRWRREFLHYLPIAEKTNKKIFEIFKKIINQ